MQAKSSAFGVAGPGADHAVLAAVLVALAQRSVLCCAKPTGDRIAVRPARVLAVDGDRPAGAPDRHDLAAAGAFAKRGAARIGLLGVVVGKAVGAARADCERARRLRRRDGTDQQARGGDRRRTTADPTSA